MLVLFLGVVYWVYGLWGGHRTDESEQLLVMLDGVWFLHLFGGICEDNQGWRGHHF